MTFAIESAIQHADLDMSFNVEDDVIVTETGCKLLAQFPREMRVRLWDTDELRYRSRRQKHARIELRH